MRRVGIWLVVTVFGIAVTGCATTQPGVYAYPQQGQTVEQLTRDQNECQVWAKQQSGFDPGTETAKGVGVGAVIGGIGGAAVGGGVAYTKNKDGYDRAYSACMTARGYVVR